MWLCSSQFPIYCKSTSSSLVALMVTEKMLYLQHSGLLVGCAANAILSGAQIACIYYTYQPIHNVSSLAIAI